MASCESKLKRNLKRDCFNKLARGLLPTVYLFHTSDVEAFLTDPDNSELITGLTLKTGAHLYVYEGKGYSVAGENSTNTTDYGKDVNHNLRVIIFSNSPEVKKEVKAILTANDIGAIAKTNGANGVWEIHGFPSGMTGDVSRNTNDDTKGAIVLNFTGSEEGLPVTLRIIDNAKDVTEARLLAMVAPD